MKKLFYALHIMLALTLQNFAFAAEVAHKSAELFTPAQVKQIEKISHDYLLKNPQILVEASKKLQTLAVEEQKAQIGKIRANISKYKNRLFNTTAAGRLVSGNPQGTIIVAEFTQHQCHHCQDATIVVNNLLKKHPEIQLITIYWPFFGADAAYTAQAVLAAKKQNKAEELNQALFANKEALTKDKTDAVIKSIRGLDNKKLDAEMKNKEYEAGLKENFKLAQDLGLIGTPALMFTNKEMTKFSLVPGQSSTFEDDLNQALNEVK